MPFNKKTTIWEQERLSKDLCSDMMGMHSTQKTRRKPRLAEQSDPLLEVNWDDFEAVLEEELAEDPFKEYDHDQLMVRLERQITNWCRGCEAWGDWKEEDGYKCPACRTGFAHICPKCDDMIGPLYPLAMHELKSVIDPRGEPRVQIWNPDQPVRCQNEACKWTGTAGETKEPYT